METLFNIFLGGIGIALILIFLGGIWASLKDF